MSEAISPTAYEGDVDPAEAWHLLQTYPDAQLVDVRTSAEWAFVGLPDLSAIDREVHCVEWQKFPSMSPNPDFTAQARAKITAAGASASTPVLFLCRSGARSRAAAIAMAAAGFSRAINVAGGFEGDLDRERHRSGVSGWKAAGLPWRQT